MERSEIPSLLGFRCPGCGESEFPDVVGVVTCECGAHIETLEPLGLRRILPKLRRSGSR